MPGWNSKAEAIMQERFGKDQVMLLATVADGQPWVRSVNACYENTCILRIRITEATLFANGVRYDL